MYFFQKSTNKWFTPKEKVVIKNTGEVPLYVFFDLPDFAKGAKDLNKAGITPAENGSSLLESINANGTIVITDIPEGSMFYLSTSQEGAEGLVFSYKIAF